METITIMSFTSNMTNDSSEIPTPSKLIQVLTTVNTACNTTFLVLILLAIGCSTSIKEIWTNLRRPVGIAVACCVEFLLMPFVGYGLPRLLKLSSPYAFATFLLTCCPGGSASNLFTYLADGCLPLSICMTTFSTLLSVGTLPLHMLIYGLLTSGGTTTTAIPIENIAITLATIIIPAGTGILLKSRFEKVAKIVSKICGPASLIVVFIGLGIRLYLDVNLYLNSPWQIFIITCFVPPIGFTLGFLISSIFKQPCYKRRTIGIETGGQNIALALSVISLSFPPGVERQQMQVLPTIQAFVALMEYFVAIGLFRLCRKFGPCKKTKEDKKELITENSDLEDGISNPTCEMKEDSNKNYPQENGGYSPIIEKKNALNHENNLSYLLSLENSKIQIKGHQPATLLDAATQTDSRLDDACAPDETDVEETVIDEMLATLEESTTPNQNLKDEIIIDEIQDEGQKDGNFAQKDKNVVIDENKVENSERLVNDHLENKDPELEYEESRL